MDSIAQNLHQWELPYLQDLWQARTPFWNLFFLVWNFIDRGEFIFFVIPLVWVFAGRKWGARFFVLSMISFVINVALKHSFEFPRPVEFDPKAPIAFANSFGFPSGAGQSAVIFPAFVLWARRPTPLIWAGAILFFLLLSFSRVYLGVHFISDVIAGWIVGAVIFTAFALLSPRVERWIQGKETIVAHLFGALMIFLQPFPPVAFGMAALMGCSWPTPEKKGSLFRYGAMMGTLLLTLFAFTFLRPYLDAFNLSLLEGYIVGIILTIL